MPTGLYYNTLQENIYRFILYMVFIEPSLPKTSQILYIIYIHIVYILNIHTYIYYKMCDSAYMLAHSKPLYNIQIVY